MQPPGPGNTTLVVTDGTIGAHATSADAVAAVLRHLARSATERIALHTGPTWSDAEDEPSGPAVRRARELFKLANDGQVLVSGLAASTLDRELPADVELADLGIHRLRDLSAPERIFELRRAGDRAASSPPLRSLDAVPNNLPVELTSFVGRDVEIGALRTRLTGERMVTIVGAGGCGKSRLAAQVIASDIERWRDGAWWVELQSVTESGVVPEVVAAAAGVLVETGAGSLRSITDQLRDRRAVVCLDNCEHVLDGVAELVAALVRSCPEVSVLATSREPLAVAGERVWRLPILGDADALTLFAERAGDAQTGIVAGDAAGLRRLCSGLDGIPLAIELAAAWMGTLTPQQIEAGLDDRFSLLVRSSRGSAARHQTLAASIDWSYDLLDGSDRAVLRQLSVFRGGFTLDAARAVCGGDTAAGDDVLNALGRLADKSLIVVDERAGESRFRLLETIRQYSELRLHEAGEQIGTRVCHLDHVLAVAESIESLLDLDKDAWCARIEPELDNLRAALGWGLRAEDADHGRRLAAATAWIWNLHGRGREGIDVLKAALGRAPGDRSILQARLLTGFAMLGDTVAPSDLDPVSEGEAIAAELGDDRLRGRCLALVAVGTFYRDFDAGWQLCADAARCAEAAEDEFGMDGARALQGIILHFRDRHDDAAEVLTPVAERLIERGDRGIASTVLTFLSNSALYTGDIDRAVRLAEHAAHVAEPLGDYHRVGTTRTQLALLQGVRGDIAGGLALLERFVHVADDAGPEVFVPGMARTLGLLHLGRGDFAEAARWLEPGAPTAGDHAGTYLDALAMPALGEALRHLDRPDDADAVLDQVEAIARNMDMPRVLADVVEQRAHLAFTDAPDRAADLFHEALAIRVDHGLRTPCIDSLEALARLLAATNRPADAVRILAAASASRESIGYVRRPVDRHDHESAGADLRQSLGDEAFCALWADGAALTLDQAVVLVRRTRGQRNRPSIGWASLTPTEMEVVRLVVDGLTNPQIGAKLFMSRGTVKTHISHVFAKVGLANRTELATFAATRLARQ